MKRSSSPRDLWASLLPTAGAVLALVVAAQFPAVAFSAGAPGAGLLLVLVLAGAAAACHRPPLGGATLGLGAVVLPSALLLSGAVPAACLAGAAFLVAELLHRLVRRNSAVQLPERRRLVRSLESTGRATLAALGAGLAWAVAARRLAGGAATVPVGPIGSSTSGEVAALLSASAWGLAAYLILWISLEAADRKIRRPDRPLLPGPLLLPPLLDAAAWALGTAVARAGQTAGWAVGGFLLGGAGALALEAFRNALLSEVSEERIEDLERVRKAAEKVRGTGQEIAAVIQQIRDECGNVVPFHWFQFELLSPGAPTKSWFSGARGELHLGAPEPESYPPAMRGFHRRVAWQILERHLRSDGVTLARLRLWCDPRRLEADALGLLDRLLPQMAASIHRSQLDREAREDPLTGVLVRRVLERRLQEVYTRCLEEGGSMAVLLCDLDFFKRINDTYGHGVGDEALVAVARILDASRRETDLCCRYGGEEFTLLLDSTDGDTALVIAERLRRAVAALEFKAGEHRVPLTLSAGVAAFPELYIKTASELLLFADGALYEAKRRGRNRCLLDLGQGRYQAPNGEILTAEDVPPVP
ncbi:MAG TPA: GGDEF domain-containing protein, partial [Thermoanaerobaculia bacterium]|nr:GGDEF domain-containing protein [Thermoanaerobaculia bacterium]